MKKKKEKRTMLFLLVILAITVGYALLSQQLNINGTAKIDKTTWKIIWNNVQVTDGSVTGDQVVQEPTIDTNKTTVEYSINLNQPKEYYEFTIDAVNEGTIDGMIDVISNKIYESDGVTEVNPTPSYLDYKVTYLDGDEIQPNHLLKSGETETYKVRIEFKDVEASQLPSSADRTLKFKFSVDYIQADENGQEVVHPRDVGLWVNDTKITDYSPEELMEEFTNMIENYWMNNQQNTNYWRNYTVHGILKYTETNNEDIANLTFEGTSHLSSEVSLNLVNGLSIYEYVSVEIDAETGDGSLVVGLEPEYPFMELNGNRLTNPHVVYNGSALSKNLEEMFAETMKNMDVEYIQMIHGHLDISLSE